MLGYAAVTVAAVGGFVACGDAGSEKVLVRISKATITSGALAYWMSEMAPEHRVPDPPTFTACIAHEEQAEPQSIRGALKEGCQQRYAELKQEALSWLISSQWLLAETSDRGLRPARNASPSSSGFKTSVEQAGARIRQMLAQKEAQVTRAEILSYYRKHIASFERKELRYIDIVERVPTQRDASKLMAEVAQGKSLSRFAPLHEEIEPRPVREIPPEKRTVYKAIFAARPHVIVGPVPLNGYSVFEVTRIRPRLVEPFAQARPAIEQKLVKERLQRALAQFVAAWRRRWIPRTECQPGYVIQKCRGYRGPTTPESPLAFN